MEMGTFKQTWDLGLLRTHPTRSAVLFACFAIVILVVALGLAVGPSVLLGLVLLVSGLAGGVSAVSIELSRRRSVNLESRQGSETTHQQ